MMNLLKSLSKLNRLWKAWNLRSFVLFSFILQCILILGSSLRIQTSNSLVRRLIWLVYLLADWAAYYAIGLIIPSSKLAQDRYTYDIRTFWAPFLLLHIGGPNSIAGFALEDNELWDRSVLHIIVQAGATAIIIYRSIPTNRLLLPTLLVFVAAFTRYLGRILALRKASKNAFASYVKEAERKLKVDNSPPHDRWAHVSMVIRSYKRFQKHIGVFCGLSTKTDGSVSENQTQLSRAISDRSFIEMEIELNIAYDIFYTKVWTMIEDKVSRVLHLLSLLSEVGALVLWALMDKRRYQKVDVRLTNTLLIGGLVIDITSFLKLIFSDLVIYHLVKCFPKSCILVSVLNKVLQARCFGSTRNLVIFRRWSGSIKQFNLLEYQTRQPSSGTLKHVHEKLVMWTIGIDKHVSTTHLEDKMKRHIFDKLKNRAMLWRSNQLPSTGKKVYDQNQSSTSGVFAAFVSEMYEAEYIQEIFKRLGPADALLLWHTTTHRFYIGEDVSESKGFNQKISEYLMYLLFRQPNKMILEGLLGVNMTVEEMTKNLERINFDDTDNGSQDEMNDHDTDNGSQDEMNDHVVLWKGVKSKGQQEQERFFNDLVSGVKDGKCISKLDKFIRKCWIETFGEHNSESSQFIIEELWIDFLMYAAIHCKARTHVRQLGEGGELLTIVWLMMNRLGITIMF